jgi:hypothetical protein
VGRGAQKRAFGLGRTRRIGASARPGALHRAWAVRHGRRLASRRQGAGRYFLPSKSGCAPAPAPGRLPEPVLVVSFPPPGSETYQLGVCYLIFQPTCGGGVSSWSTRTDITVLIVHLLSTAADSLTEVELLQIMELVLVAAPPASLLAGGTGQWPGLVSARVGDRRVEGPFLVPPEAPGGRPSSGGT